MKRTFILAHQQARDSVSRYAQEAAQGLVVTFSEPTRTGEQNAKLWACLSDVAHQVDWYGKKLTPEDWKKAVFSQSQKAIGCAKPRQYGIRCTRTVNQPDDKARTVRPD